MRLIFTSYPRAARRGGASLAESSRARRLIWGLGLAASLAIYATLLALVM